MNCLICATNNIEAALEILWKGMLGIFIVMGVIYLSVIALNRLTAKTDKEDKSSKANKSKRDSNTGAD